MIELLFAVLLGAALSATPLALALRLVSSTFNREHAAGEHRAIAQQAYITELQNRLGSHTWGEFAQLQNGVDTANAQASRVINSFGESRPEEAYGESAEDVAERIYAELGVDLEGPTLG